MLTDEIKQSIEKSVLCWLATSAEGTPNVSPKEVFTHFGDTHILLANIASPQTVKNIKKNSQVCISFIDILIQKGFQLKGHATILTKTHPSYSQMEEKLLHITQGKFPFPSITSILIQKAKPILAPSYLLYPDTTEATQIEKAKEQYGI